MINLSNVLMYIQYLCKIIKLNFLKVFKGLDYTGRIENTDNSLHGYEGCYPVNRLIKMINITPKDNIIDIGCGKGLFLYYASKYNFNRIDGVEYSSKLIKIAKKNVKALRDGRMHIYHCDARCFAKYYKYNFFFINNPFSYEVMEKVVLEIIKSYSIKKRRIVIIYQFPFNQEVFIKHGFKILYEKFPNTILLFE